MVNRAWCWTIVSDEPKTQTVRGLFTGRQSRLSQSRRHSASLRAGLAETGSHQFTIGVEDGRGGFDQQSLRSISCPSYAVQYVVKPSAISIAVVPATVANSHSGVHLFIDTNGNGYPDPSESQTTTDTNGNYQFNGLLPGNIQCASHLWLLTKCRQPAMYR